MSELTPEAEGLYRGAHRSLMSNDYEEAKAGFALAAALCPGAASPHLGLGEAFFFQEPPDYEAAIREFEIAKNLRADWADAYLWLGGAQEKVGRLGEAIKSLREAARLAPQDSRVHISLGTCLTQSHDYKAAITALRRGIALKPHYGLQPAYLFLADALRGAGRLREACELWQKIADMEPEYPEKGDAQREAQECLAKHCQTSATKGKRSENRR
jgi:tetratricopeptide (TPR) repeat protein